MANSTEGANKITALKAAGGHYYGSSPYDTERDALGLGINAWIDQYMTDNLAAPPKEDYAEFIEAYTDITERVERIVREKEQKKREKRQAKEEKRRQRERERERERRAIVDKFLLDLELLIDEPYRVKAMAKVGGYYGRFVTPFIEDLVDPWIRSKGIINDNTSTEVANKINEILRLFPKLLELNFLSDDDAFEKAAKAFFREKFPNVEALFNNTSGSRFGSNDLDSQFVDLLKDGQSFKAMCSLGRNDLSPVLLATEPTASLASSSSHLGIDFRTLARRVWRKHWDHLDTDSSFDSTKNTLAFQASHNYIGQIIAKVDRYAKWLGHEDEVEEEYKYTHKSMIRDIVCGYDSKTLDYYSNTLDYFMEQKDFELVKKYQTDSNFRWDEFLRLQGQI